MANGIRGLLRGKGDEPGGERLDGIRGLAAHGQKATAPQDSGRLPQRGVFFLRQHGKLIGIGDFIDEMDAATQPIRHPC